MSKTNTIQDPVRVAARRWRDSDQLYRRCMTCSMLKPLGDFPYNPHSIACTGRVCLACNPDGKTRRASDRNELERIRCLVRWLEKPPRRGRVRRLDSAACLPGWNVHDLGRKIGSDGRIERRYSVGSLEGEHFDGTQSEVSAFLRRVWLPRARAYLVGRGWSC